MPELQIEWTFTPENYFEEPLVFEAPGLKFEIGMGCVLARLPDQEPSRLLCQDAHAKLLAIFRGAQLLEPQRFTVAGAGSIARIYEDGRRDAIVFVEGMGIKFSVGRFDAETKDAAGNIVEDSRATRIRQRSDFARLALASVEDPTAALILRSYSAAFADSRNEFFYMYEIRDALVVKFGNVRAARNAVGMSAEQWSTLGRLTCVEPLNQGRHRGRAAGELRDATQEELDTVRGLAREMIRRYLSQCA